MLYGCEAWSLTLREECRLRVFENIIIIIIIIIIKVKQILYCVDKVEFGRARASCGMASTVVMEITRNAGSYVISEFQGPL